MTLVGDSRPASQSEHLISHYIDMRGDPAWPASFHGEHIAVTTVTAARLQDMLLNSNAPRVRPCGAAPEDFTARYGPDLGAACWKEFAPKRLDAEAAGALNARLESDWDVIRDRLAGVARPESAILAALRAAGAPAEPAHIGVPLPFYSEAVRHAREIRNRYTCLDFAAACGIGV